MAPVEIIAIITPSPGKADRVQELLSAQAAFVQQNEPETLRYHIVREISSATPSFVVVEKYTGQDAVKTHGASAPFKEMGRTFKKEGLLASPMKVIFVRGVAGFEERRERGSKL